MHVQMNVHAAVVVGFRQPKACRDLSFSELDMLTTKSQEVSWCKWGANYESGHWVGAWL